MQLRRPSLRRKLALTPLIDVIFLLLLFFMLSSTFSRFGEVELLGQSGAAGGELSGQSPLFLRLGRERLDLNGEAMTLAELEAALSDKTAAHVLMTLQADVTAQRLTELMVALRAAGDLHLTVLGGTP